jgi:hypothetical protein
MLENSRYKVKSAGLDFDCARELYGRLRARGGA